MQGSRLPIYNALREYADKNIKAFHTPAHKGLRFLPGLENFITPEGLACDLPCMDETDFWNHPSGCIAQAKRNAAQLYDAADTFFLVNGSTLGNHVMMMAAIPQGGKLLIPRNFHISAFSAMALAGVIPEYIPARWADGIGPVPVTTEMITSGMDENTRAVFLTNPTYYGISGDISGIAEACKKKNTLLLVDEAHGAHLAFLPPGFARPALEAGADMVVQSLHKTIGSMIGTAQLHLGRHSRLEGKRIQYMLNLLQSTSPSNILLSSLELANHWLAEKGTASFQQMTDRILALRWNLSGIDGIKVIDTSSSYLEGCRLDPVKLTIDVSGLGITGFAAERVLKNEFKILCEFSDWTSVVFVLGPHDSADDYSALEKALATIARQSHGGKQMPQAEHRLKEMPVPGYQLAPREACLADKRVIPAEEAAGKVCGELISVYPPGIPLICPGELVTQEVLDYLRLLNTENACVYAQDQSLQSILIIDN